MEGAAAGRVLGGLGGALPTRPGATIVALEGERRHGLAGAEHDE
jgi:hypothetical protein